MIINVSIACSDQGMSYACWYNDLTVFKAISHSIDLGHIDDDCKERVRGELERYLNDKYATKNGVDHAELQTAALTIKQQFHRKYVCVHAGTSANAPEYFYKAARELGEKLAEADMGIVYGGGNIGLMGSLADGALAKKGKVVGVITPEIRKLNVVHKDIVVYEEKTYEDRKRRMAEIADSGFISLPGGIGTLDEFTEAAVHNQFASFAPTVANPVKAISLLNVEGFYDDLQRQIQKCTKMGFYPAKHADMIYITSSIDDCIRYMREYKASAADVSRWWEKPISPVETMNQQRRASQITSINLPTSTPIDAMIAQQFTTPKQN